MKISCLYNSFVKSLVLIVVLTLLGNTLFAQDEKLTKEVQVVRPYEPSISDAFKLNLMPQVEDTTRIVPTFTYNLALRPTTTEFPVTPIPHARMVSEPLNKVYRGYIKAGFGNYTSPLGEIYFANSRSKDYSWGAWITHHSSFGSVKLDNNDKINAPYQLSRASVFGKRIFSKSALSGEIGYKQHNYNFYGIDTLIDLTTTQIEAVEQMQRNIFVGGSYYSTHSDSLHINYNLNARFNAFSDAHSMEQNTFSLSAKADKFFRIERVGGDISFTHHMRSTTLNPTNNSILKVNPWIGLFGKQWRAKAGIGFALDNNNDLSQTYFFPVGHLSYDIVGNYVIPYFEFGGYLEDNNYAKILSENPWIRPGLNILNTNRKMIMKGGVKGNFSPRMAYNLSASFSLIDSMYFFVNNKTTGNNYLDNYFEVVYDNPTYKHFMGELTIAPTTRIKFFIQAEYNSYALQDIDYPWHKPDYVGRFIANYNLRNKFILKASFYIEGKRWIQTANPIEPIQINGLMDANVGIEYRYNSWLSAFIDLNNITSNRYQIWYLYPAQQFNMKLGFSVAF